MSLDRSEIIQWLTETDSRVLETLWERANTVRRNCVGDAVHLRGLIEISNHCVRRCQYCGINVEHRELQRYRMSMDEIIACARKAESFGYGTVVIQAGEDPGLSGEFVEQMIRRIKAETALAITLSLGERSDEELQRWQQAGANRYLLRFETSDRALYERIHPSLGRKVSDRIAMLKGMRTMGYEIGSGVMIGIPGQSWEILADDLLMFLRLDLDMIGVGPFIAHPDTPLGQVCGRGTPPHPDSNSHPASQVPNDELTTYKVLALTRLLCPQSNIPSTTALATLNTAEGRELGLERGANVVMPNLTPVRYRSLYEIYPAKACIHETAEACQGCLAGRIARLGRQVGQGPGDSPNYRSRRQQAAAPDMPRP